MNIFVFGSNEAGRHGKGAALVARRFHGAKNGVGNGPQGKSYGIPTKNRNLRVLKTKEIRSYVNEFMAHAAQNLDDTFQVTQIGCGLAGFKPSQIAPMFSGAPPNVEFDGAWREWLPNHATWGHY